jgi:integrase
MTLALELEANGSHWFTHPALGTVLFATLYDALRDAGAPLPPRCCGHCGAETSLTAVLLGRRCCRKCAWRGSMTTCGGCGQLADIERRQPDGSRLCQRCTNTLADESAVCIACGHHRVIGQRTSDGPICGSCRGRQRTDTCTQCGRHAPCRFAGTVEAICEPCAVTRRPCIRCEQQRVVHSRTSLGEPICHGCAMPVIETCTDCGRDRRVHGRAAGAPYCSSCYAKNPVSFRDCTRCGTRAHLTANGLCAGCDATAKINTLFPGELVAASPQIRALRDACLASEPAIILRAFRRKGSTEILRALLSSSHNISHAALDALGGPAATRTARSLLVEHGVLVHRDEHLAHLEVWIDTVASEVPDPRDRRAFTQFARWRHLRVLRGRSAPASYGQAASRRRELRLILDLLTWARGRGTSLDTLTQGDVDRWLAGGSLDRRKIKAFLRWAHRNGYSRSITFTTNHERTLIAAGISDDDRWQLLQTVFTTGNAAASGTRLAAALVLLYGVRLHRIAALKLSDVMLRDNFIHVRLGRDPLLLPDELGPLAEAVTRDRSADRLFGAVHDSEWLFPGTIAGYPLSVDGLTSRVKSLGVSPRQARKTALAALAMQLPPAIISRLTGLHVVTAGRWAEAVAASSARYAAIRLSQPTAGGH